MATPIIQKINAFDASRGTALTFNVVGATNIIRSSKVSIYNSNNDKICTHIYNSTQLQHILPGNNASATESNPAIVYEQGKSYLDFTNGKSYYLEIDVYTTVNATGSSAGTSIKTQFWCLSYPEVSFINPASSVDIASSSYTFDLSYQPVYPEGVSIPISNRVQSYRMDLYKGTEIASVLVNTSGNIYGAGTQSGENLYNLSYTFYNLDNDSSYYVIATIITEQGMTLTEESNNIFIKLEDVSFSVVSVKNDACNGKIDITSNITNISGSTNAEFHNGDGHINLTGSGDFVSWGGQEDSVLNFPSTLVGNRNVMRWSIIIKAKDVNTSDSNPSIDNINNTNTYFLYMHDKDEQNGIYVYMRDAGSSSIVAELYSMDSYQGKSKGSFVQSNVLESVNSNTDIYMLIRCCDGWYDIKLAKELPTGGV